MPIRIVRFHSRNPFVGALLIALVLALLTVFLTVGLTLAAGAAAVGGAGILARRVLAQRRRPVARAGLGRGQEVFPPAPGGPMPPLPPGAG